MLSRIKLLQAILDTYQIPGIVEAETIVDNETVYRIMRQPEKGNTSLSKYASEIARHLGVEKIGVAKLPEINAYSIAVPYRFTDFVSIDELLASSEFSGAESRLSFALGKDSFGETIIGDLEKMPHLLVGGGADFGKSVFLDSLIMSLIRKSTPDEVNLVLISTSTQKLSSYRGVPHLACPVITETKSALKALEFLETLISKRFIAFGTLTQFLHSVIKKNRNLRSIYGDGVISNIRDYNKAGIGNDRAVMPYVVVVIDELAGFVGTEGRSYTDVQESISRLGTKARAAGIHFVLATSQVDSSILADTIKTYCPSRIAFKQTDADSSRAILDRSGAEELLGGGDMLFLQMSESMPKRVQGAYISEDAVPRAVKSAMANAVVHVDGLGMSGFMSEVIGIG